MHKLYLSVIISVRGATAVRHKQDILCSFVARLLFCQYWTYKSNPNLPRQQSAISINLCLSFIAGGTIEFDGGTRCLCRAWLGLLAEGITLGAVPVLFCV